MISVCVFSAAYGRFAVTRLVLDQRARLCGELAGCGIAANMLIVADDENLDIAAEYGAETLERPNKPLGQKMNDGLRVAAEMADYVVWIGSDDWVHPDVFKSLKRRRRPAADPATVTVGRKLVVVEMETGHARRVCSPSKYGAIPWIIDSVLLRGHDPIKPELQRGLDGALIRGIRLNRRHPRSRGFTVNYDDLHEFRCVDFKCVDNITPYERLRHLAACDEEMNIWSDLAAWYPVDLVAKAQALSEQMGGKRRETRQSRR